MRIESAFVAGHVEQHAGTLYAHGAFAGVLFVPHELPFGRAVSLGLVAEFADDELGDTFALEFRLRGPDSTTLYEGDMVLWVEAMTGIEDAPNFVVTPFLMTAEFKKEGLHLVEISRFEELLYTVRFSVAVG